MLLFYDDMVQPIYEIKLENIDNNSREAKSNE